MQKMSSLTFPDGSSYEITDDKARKDITETNNNVSDVQGAIDEVSRTLGYTMSKNLLKFPYFMDKNLANGITWTVNSDGSVTPSGTSTDESNTVLQHRINNPLKLKKGKYILSGCPKGGSTDTYSLLVLKTVGDTYEIIAQDVGEGVEFELTEDTNVGVLCKVWKSGVTISGTYYPMIRDADIKDDTYEPYVADLDTRINNIKTDTYEKLLDKTVSASANSQTLTIPNYNEYNELFIRLRADDNNGLTLLIPKSLYGITSPFYIDATNQNSTGYKLKAQGYFTNGNLVIRYSALTGWSTFSVMVLGLK